MRQLQAGLGAHTCSVKRATKNPGIQDGEAKERAKEEREKKKRQTNNYSHPVIRRPLAIYFSSPLTTLLSPVCLARGVSPPKKPIAVTVGPLYSRTVLTSPEARF